MDSTERIEEFFEDGGSSFGSMLVFMPKRDKENAIYWIDFEVHEIQARRTDIDGSGKNINEGVPEYEIYNSKGECGDDTPNLAEACPQVCGVVKWDGCSHVNFGNAVAPGKPVDGYLHLCGGGSWRWLTACLTRVFERAKQMVIESGGNWMGDQ